jgi:hypothetical protein
MTTAPTTIPLYTYYGVALSMARQMSDVDLLILAAEMNPGVVANPPAAANHELRRRYIALLEEHRILQEDHDAVMAAIRALVPPGGSQAL